MAKKKSNTGMIIAIIVSVIVVGIVVWGFLTKWKFIGDDGKSTEKAKAKNDIMNTPTDTKVVEVTPKMEEKSKKIQQKYEEKIKSMSDEDIKNKINEIKKKSEKKLSSFRIIEHMTDEETDGSSTPKKCEFTDEEIETVVTKALNLIKIIKPDLDVTTAIPRIVNYYKKICDDEADGLTPNKSDLCQEELKYEFNPHTLGLYNSLALIKPPEGSKAGYLYKWRYFLFSTEDKQTVEWSNEPESKEIRMLYKLYQYLKACPVVQAPPAPPAPPGACDDSKYTARDSWGDGCPEYRTTPEWCGSFDSGTFQSKNCCACKFKHLPGKVVYSDQGFDLEVLGGSLAKCKQKCDSEAECVAFVFDTIRKNKCWLKKATNKSGESLNDSIKSAVRYDLYMKNT